VPAPLAKSLFVSLRPHQWTKNLVVFAALLFGRQLFNPTALAATAGAFAVFCGLSGVVYLVNDVMDREADRLHPKKRFRPIASGALPVGVALTWAVLIALTALAGAVAIGRGFAVVALVYLAMLTV
jgi:4-hydroxybenzoate polyprenyltransferase